MPHTGWWGDKVIITLLSDGSRRLKNWCEYYDKVDKHCAFRVTKCCGASQCEYYKKKAGVGPVEWHQVPAEVPVVHIVDQPVSNVESKPETKVKTLADFIPGHNPPFGEKLLGKVVIIKQPRRGNIGEVVDENHDYIIIERDDGRVSKFERKTTIRVKALWVVDDLSGK